MHRDLLHGRVAFGVRYEAYRHGPHLSPEMLNLAIYQPLKINRNLIPFSGRIADE